MDQFVAIIRYRTRLALLIVASLFHQSAFAIDFRREVLPVLSDKCFLCHGPDEQSRQAELRLDLRESAIEHGAIVAGEPDSSVLVDRIFAEDDSMMPPPHANKQLSQQEKDTIRQWIAEGAEYEKHWAYEPIQKPIPPTVDEGWPRSEIDRIVFAQLQSRGLQPSPEVPREVLLRRVTQDLTGLPPTIEELNSFLSDLSPNAYERAVDRLLHSVDYAERMATIWLDNARYADSNGYQFDNVRQMWPWRDWVIRAFQANMPFDQFVKEQLAGDLLPDATRDQRIATGFNRNHGTTIEGGVIDEEYRVMYINDETTTAGTLFLGLTLECCRCHDHKYDPISMKEYYSLYAFFNSNAEIGIGEKGKPIAPRINVAGGYVMVMQETPRSTHVLIGGQFDQPGEEVFPDTPAVLPAFGDRPRNRLGLADWLTHAENPLLARVTVNRVWQQLFGVGLVKTVDNFGVQGEIPIYGELIDWLAADFRDSGWDMHHLMRTIVLSATYRQSSGHRSELHDPENRLLARGPSFRLPAELIRDQALAVSGLLVRKVGGPSVRPYQPPGIWEDLNAPDTHAEVYARGTGDDLYRKSMYTFWRRAALHPTMAVFDAPNRDLCTVERSTTNTPLQALALSHDPMFIEAARKLAERAINQHSEHDANAHIAFAIRATLSRHVTDYESKLLGELHRARLAYYQSHPKSVERLLSIGDSGTDVELKTAEVAAMADVCLAIFNLSETITRK